ncbi:hypothetical protein XENOCAPTIV_010333 [Xenoophorus captivus]|uniref:Uncharacterized protein n=1 Tax=Xenoophorus captivus TaxID=1517983 RepID=A0ABV0RZ22_9TELE
MYPQLAGKCAMKPAIVSRRTLFFSYSIIADKRGERGVFLSFHFSLQTQPGDMGGGMMGASTCPRSTIGLPAMSLMIYDAIKMNTVFFFLSFTLPRVTVLS